MGRRKRALNLYYYVVLLNAQKYVALDILKIFDQMLNIFKHTRYKKLEITVNFLFTFLKIGE